MESVEESKKKIRGVESKSHRRILNISYKEINMNILVNNLINEKVGSYVPLLGRYNYAKKNDHIQKYYLTRFHV